MTFQTKNAAFRELAAAEIDAVAGAGFEEPTNYPENGVYKPYQPVEGIDPSTIPEEMRGFWTQLAWVLFEVALEDLLTPDTQPTTIWMESPAAPGHSVNEVYLSNWFADVGMGNSSVTGYSSVSMANVGNGTYMGAHTDQNGATTTFISQDLDHDGATDVVYMKDEAGNWWQATSTTNGEPNWTRCEPPRLSPPNVDE